MDKVIKEAKKTLGCEEKLASDFVYKIDTFKIMGLNGPEAASKFFDYCSFLNIPETPKLVKFFWERWSDSKVHIQVPKELEKYVRSDHPIFTPPRLEPVYQEKPYYKQGLPQQRGLGKGFNKDVGGSVLVPPPPQEEYSNFIIKHNVPDIFYIMIPNEQLEEVLLSGFSATNSQYPYSIFDSFDSAQGYYLTLPRKSSVSQHDLIHTGTVLSIDSNYLDLHQDVFYTRKYSAKHFKRIHGYFYTGEISNKALKIVVR